MQEHRATSSNTFRERMTIRALNSLERATNFSEMTAVRKFMAGTAIVGSMFGSGITAALAENISENRRRVFRSHRQFQNLRGSHRHHHGCA